MNLLSLLLVCLPTAPTADGTFPISHEWNINFKGQVLDWQVEKQLKFDPDPDKLKLVVTDDTDVQLDGKKVKFPDVPKVGVEVVELHVAADKKTILKIYFKTVKP